MQMVFCDDVVWYYDLIVLDEVESKLTQINSNETFKNSARNNYDYLNEITNTSLAHKGNIRSMDGDLGARALYFLEKYGNTCNIINKMGFNKFKLLLTPDKSYFEGQIWEALSNNLSIVIPTMSAGYANLISLQITSK